MPRHRSEEQTSLKRPLAILLALAVAVLAVFGVVQALSGDDSGTDDNLAGEDPTGDEPDTVTPPDTDAATATESRAVVLGHMQRGGTPTACDRVLATQFGHAALVEAMEGHTDVMVGRKGTRIVPVPLSHVANRQRLVEPDSQIVRAARAVGTSFGDE